MDSFNITIDQDKKQVFINVYFNTVRSPFWNGKAIDIRLRCINNPPLKKAAFELKLREVWRPQPKKKKIKKVPITVIQALNQGAKTEIAQGCSERFIKDAKRSAVFTISFMYKFTTKKRVPIADYSLVAGTGFFPPRCF
jgi:hypothetical protein